MRIACIVAKGFEDTEFAVPYIAMKKAGHTVTVIGTEKGAKLTGKNDKEMVTTEASIADVRADAYDALFIPGGNSPDVVKEDERFVRFVKGFQSKQIFAICHGPRLLIAADMVRGKTMTAAPSVQPELIQAGAKVIDRDVVTDGNLVTSRKPEDVQAFTKEVLARLSRATTSATHA